MPTTNTAPDGLADRVIARIRTVAVPDELFVNVVMSTDDPHGPAEVDLTVTEAADHLAGLVRAMVGGSPTLTRDAVSCAAEALQVTGDRVDVPEVVRGHPRADHGALGHR